MNREECFGKNAKWLEFSDARKHPCPITEKTFFAEKVEKAVLTVCGLGFFEGYLNGERIGTDYFKPALSDTLDRDFTHLLYPLPDKTSHRVYVLRYDVTSMIFGGENTLSFLLGSGFFNKTKRRGEGDVSFSSSLFLIYRLVLTENGVEKEIFSDETTLFKPSHILESEMYHGEKVDFSRINKGGYAPCKPCDFPDIPYFLQTCPCDRVCEKIVPKKIGSAFGFTLYDVGKNVTGWLAGTGYGNVAAIYAEELKKGFLPDFEHSGGAGQKQIDRFMHATGQTLRPTFRWNSFRYVYVRGKLKNPVVEVVGIPFRQTATFETDDDVLNALFDNYIRTQRNNMHAGVPSDCPHRERLGYTGDGQLTTETALLTLDADLFYRKWFDDILDCQDKSSGHIQHTAPFMGGGGGPAAWGGAIVLAPYKHYRVVGDADYVAKFLPNMERWIDYTVKYNFAENESLIVREAKGGWCLGDWCTLQKIALPEPYVNTCLFVKILDVYAELCAVANKPFRYDSVKDGCMQAIKTKYYDAEKNTFCGGVQGADFFAADIGLLDQKGIEKAIKRYSELGFFDTGIVGTDILLKTFFEHGFRDEGTRLLRSRKKGSFGYMSDRGATTLWEYWDGNKSRNHPMFGSAVKYLFTGIAGIDYDAGFRHVTVTPALPDGLKRIECTVTRPDLTLRLRYTVENGAPVYFIRYAGMSSVAVDFGGKATKLEPDTDYFFS